MLWLAIIAADDGTSIPVLGAAVGAVAVLAVGILNHLTQRRQLREQRELFERQLQDARIQLDVLREGQITERYTRAVDQLGSDKPDVRLGAIYALERVALGSDLPVTEILSAYVQGHAPWPPQAAEQPPANWGREKLPVLASWSPDVQAAMVVLGRRPGSSAQPQAGQPTLGQDALNLANVDLRRVQVPGAQLNGAVLRDSSLARAVLAGAELRNADLARSNLEGADLRDVDLQQARLRRANLRHADLGGANLEEADLEYTDLDGAMLNGARLQAARATQETRWPAGFDPNLHGVVVRSPDQWR